MTNAEQAIRNALAKVNASNTALRRRVYESAWNAHERSLINDPRINDLEQTKRRNQLSEIIIKIESEYKVQPKPNLEDPTNLEDGFFTYGPEDHIEINDEENYFERSHRTYKKAVIGRKKWPIVMTTLIVIGFIFIAFVVWSFFNSLNKTSPNLESPTTPQASIHKPLPNKPKQTQPENGWIRFFNPADITSLSTKGAASAQIKDDLGEPYVYVFANSPEDAAIVEIGPGVLMNMRGKKAMIDIDTKSAGATSSQLSLTCDLGGGNDCGRRRFEVPPVRDHLLFEVQIPADGKGAGKILLTSDILGEGNAVNIYSMSIKAVD